MNLTATLEHIMSAAATVFIVRAINTLSTPHGIIFGDHVLVYADKAEADALAEELNDDDCWGVDGAQLPAAVGIEYLVEEVRLADLEDVWRAQAIAAGLLEEYVLATGPDADEWGRYPTKAEAIADADADEEWSVWAAKVYDDERDNSAGPVARS